MRAINKLSARKVEALTKPGLYGDGLGLYLQVSAYDTKSWIFRFMRDGRPRKMGIGALHTVSLAEARLKAAECRRKLLEDVDPIAERASRKADRRAAEAKVLTFKECAERYIKAHGPGWKNQKHAAQWTATLSTYVFSAFGSVDVGKVDTSLVLKVLEPIWNEKAETASRVRGRIESILDWAKARHYRDGENPARWRGHLDKLLPARSKVQKVEHHAALPYREIASFMADLRGMDGNGARALEFAILTAGRTGEVVGARWDEIDLAEKMWTVPAGRMKAGREHRVPLSDRALEILAALPREKGNPFVFIGQKRGENISGMTMAMLLRRMGPDATVHGFRSAFKDWSSETTSFANEVTEMALAHAVGNKVERAYKRGDLFDKRRRLMEAWAGFCAMPAAAAKSNVVPLRGDANG